MFKLSGERLNLSSGKMLPVPDSPTQARLGPESPAPAYGPVFLASHLSRSKTIYSRGIPMANILYGVNGEGAGHSTRAKEVISHLQAKGHTVRIVSFDRGLRNLSESFEVTEIFGLRIAYVNNRMRYRRTLAKNLITAPRAARSMARLMCQAEEWQIELVITDFEPLSCHVGHRKRLPVISIDNQ